MSDRPFPTWDGMRDEDALLAIDGNGRWVYVDDVMPVLADRNKRIAELEAENHRLVELVDKAHTDEFAWDPIEAHSRLTLPDIDELLVQARKLNEPRRGSPVIVGKLEDYEVIATRGQMVAYANEIIRCRKRVAEMEAALRLIADQDEPQDPTGTWAADIARIALGEDPKHWTREVLGDE